MSRQVLIERSGRSNRRALVVFGDAARSSFVDSRVESVFRWGWSWR